jgi:Sulfatase
MNLLKKIPFFLWLLPVFFCLHGTVENFGVLGIAEVLLIGLYISTALALLFLLLWGIAKNKMNAAISSFWAGLIYLFFGALHDWLKSHAFFSFMQRYMVLLPLLLLGLITLYYFLKRKEAFRKKIFLYLNWLLIIYCLLDAGLLINHAFSNKKNNAAQVVFNSEKVTTKPDVYYLLFDEYPGYNSLQSAFAFKNDTLYHFLQGRGFTIQSSFSNYNFTAFSMSSIFNMQYVAGQYNREHQLSNQEDFRKRFTEIRNGQVFAVFGSMGYGIENYSLFDVGNSSSINAAYSFLPVHTRVLTGKMLHNRLRKDIGWWFRGSMLQNSFAYTDPIYGADETNNEILEKINSSLGSKSQQPKFCYAHFTMPHSPYFRDSAGALISKNNPQAVDLSDTKHFLPYLKYTNSIIVSLVNKIVQHDSAAIIVIMSDHGFRDYNNHRQFYQPAFDNICAVRLPGLPALPNAPQSGVNFFRYLFNSQYGQQIPYLKDSTIWINY